MSELANLLPDEHRCRDAKCEKSAKCARFLQRNHKRSTRVHDSLASKHAGQPCLFFREQPRIIDDKQNRF